MPRLYAKLTPGADVPCPWPQRDLVPCGFTLCLATDRTESPIRMPFWCGPGFGEPTVTDALECLIDDVVGPYCAGSIPAYIEDMGVESYREGKKLEAGLREQLDRVESLGLDVSDLANLMNRCDGGPEEAARVLLGEGGAS